MKISIIDLFTQINKLVIIILVELSVYMRSAVFVFKEHNNTILFFVFCLLKYHWACDIEENKYQRYVYDIP